MTHLYASPTPGATGPHMSDFQAAANACLTATCDSCDGTGRVRYASGETAPCYFCGKPTDDIGPGLFLAGGPSSPDPDPRADAEAPALRPVDWPSGFLLPGEVTCYAAPSAAAWRDAMGIAHLAPAGTTMVAVTTIGSASAASTLAVVAIDPVAAQRLARAVVLP